jgi:hypothetical protein
MVAEIADRDPSGRSVVHTLASHPPTGSAASSNMDLVVGGHRRVCLVDACPGRDSNPHDLSVRGV